MWRHCPAGVITISSRNAVARRRSTFALLQMPGGARFVSVSNRTMKLWTLNGTLERTFTVGSDVTCVAALPGLCGRPWPRPQLRRGPRGTTSTARSSTPPASAQLPGERGDGDDRRPAHRQRLGQGARSQPHQGVERRQQPSEQRRAHRRRERGRCPTARFISGGGGRSASNAVDCTVLAPQRHPREHLRAHADEVRRAARQPARALRLERQHRQALQRQQRRRPAHLHAPHSPGRSSTANTSSAARATTTAARATTPPASSKSAAARAHAPIARLHRARVVLLVRGGSTTMVSPTSVSAQRSASELGDLLPPSSRASTAGASASPPAATAATTRRRPPRRLRTARGATVGGALGRLGEAPRARDRRRRRPTPEAWPYLL